MHRAFAVSVAAPLAVIAVLATAPASTGRGPDVASHADQNGIAQTNSKPVVLAQGRCFNGRCF
jgi:hypothetical protein